MGYAFVARVLIVGMDDFFIYANANTLLYQ